MGMICGMRVPTKWCGQVWSVSGSCGHRAVVSGGFGVSGLLGFFMVAEQVEHGLLRHVVGGGISSGDELGGSGGSNSSNKSDDEGSSNK